MNCCRSVVEQSGDDFHRQVQAARLLLQGEKAEVPVETLGSVVFGINHDGHRGSPVRSYMSHMSAADCIHVPTNDTICP